jgi:hypothetical protein
MANILEDFGIIDNKIHNKMVEANNVRNDIVNRSKHPDSINESAAREAIEKGIICLKALGVN